MKLSSANILHKGIDHLDLSIHTRQVGNEIKLSMRYKYWRYLPEAIKSEIENSKLINGNQFTLHEDFIDDDDCGRLYFYNVIFTK